MATNFAVTEQGAAVVLALMKRAAANGRSAEDEHREILN